MISMINKKTKRLRDEEIKRKFQKSCKSYNHRNHGSDNYGLTNQRTARQSAEAELHRSYVAVRNDVCFLYFLRPLRFIGAICGSSTPRLPTSLRFAGIHPSNRGEFLTSLRIVRFVVYVFRLLRYFRGCVIKEIILARLF